MCLPLGETNLIVIICKVKDFLLPFEEKNLLTVLPTLKKNKTSCCPLEKKKLLIANLKKKMLIAEKILLVASWNLTPGTSERQKVRNERRVEGQI